jgi:hypothetical protein
MTVQGMAESSTPTVHSVRVNWFQRDPGGTAIFVMPADDECPTPQPVAEHDDGVGGSRD